MNVKCYCNVRECTTLEWPNLLGCLCYDFVVYQAVDDSARETKECVQPKTDHISSVTYCIVSVGICVRME